MVSPGDITLFSSRPYSVEGTIDITRKILIPKLCLFELKAGPNLISKSIVPPSWKNLIQHLTVLLLITANEDRLDLRKILLLHAHAADLEVRTWLSIVNELAGDALFRTPFKDRHMRDIVFSLRKITLRCLRPVYITMIGQKREKPTSSVVGSEILAVTESPIQDGIRVAQEMVTTPRLELSVLVMSNAAGLRIINLELLTWVREQVGTAGSVGNILSLEPYLVLLTNY